MALGVHRKLVSTEGEARLVKDTLVLSHFITGLSHAFMTLSILARITSLKCKAKRCYVQSVEWRL